MAKKPRKYYTLLSREHKTAPWVIEFGDYKRNVVRQERDDMKDGDYWNHAFKIIETGDWQMDISAAVTALNYPVQRAGCDPRCLGGYCVLTNSSACRMSDAALNR